MHLPTQSQPVQRTIPSQPFAHRDTGVAPSAYGIQPSILWGRWDDGIDPVPPWFPWMDHWINFVASPL